MSDKIETVAGDAAPAADGAVDRAVTEGGAYEVLRRRLDAQGEALRTRVDALNAARIEAFGASRMEMIGRVRIRTEHNCVARDIVQVGDCPRSRP